MTKQVKIYHNPRCSKSRETLNLLKENGVEPEVVLYLETPADAATLRDLLKMLGMNSARELMRQKEDLYKELNLADSSLSEEALRSEEHTSELQSRFDLVCRLLLAKKRSVPQKFDLQQKDYGNRVTTHYRTTTW